MGQTKQFSMPVVLQNLPPCETLNQVIDNLNFLYRAMDQAFNSISNQVKEEREKINKITSRVEQAQSKVDIISKYPNKATTVFSHAEFPMDKVSTNPPLVLITESEEKLSHPKYKLSLKERSQRPVKTLTLDLFHSLQERTQYQKNELPKGLGKLPSWIDSVSDCLLFNTDENPYLKYDNLDNLEGEDVKERSNDKLIKELAEAPKTIKDRDTLMDPETYDITYQPQLFDIPRYNVPSILPLGGLALDITWNEGTTNNPSRFANTLAPSSITLANLPDAEALPEFFDSYSTPGATITPGKNITPNGILPPPLDGPNILPPSIETVVGVSSQINTSTSTTTTPTNTFSQQHQQQQQQQQPIVSSLPIIKEKEITPGNQVPIQSENKPPELSVAPSRLSLLEAIKDPSKRRKTKVKVQQVKKELPKPAKTDLMSHLKEKLTQRNKIIRGKTDQIVSASSNSLPAVNDSTLSLPSLDEESIDIDDQIAKSKKGPGKTDQTGLGLHNIPKHMQESMLHLPTVDDDDDDDDSVNHDDKEWI